MQNFKILGQHLLGEANEIRSETKLLDKTDNWNQNKTNKIGQ